MAELVAKLVGEDSGLQDALEGVARASREVNQTLEELDDTLSEISAASETAESGVENLSESTKDVRNSSAAATETAKKLNDEFRSTTVRAETANIFVGQLGSEITKTAGKSEALQTSISGLNSENLQLAATANVAKRGIDDMGDEATETTGELIGAASAAELLSLQSSALSINVGAFTVALRNLTTQVPVLVATLGNLSSAFIGLGAAIGASGIGGAALAFGGLLAKAENAGADLNDFESVLSALEPTSQALQEALIEAFRPVIEAEGAVSLLDSLIQGLVDTVSSFSSVVANAFEGTFGETAGGGELQSLATTFSQIGTSFNENIDAINQAIGQLVIRLGDDLAGITDSVLSGLPGFLREVTVATEEVINIVAVAGDGFGQFVSEVSNLGRTIGAGLAPVLDSFFSVLADVAVGINSLGEETLATVVKVGALIIAINRLAGIMGSLVTPLAAVSATLTSFATDAGGFIQAFTQTITAAADVSSRASSGIGKLSQAFELMLPPLGESTSVLGKINKKVSNSEGIFARAKERVDEFDSSNRSLKDDVSGLASAFSDISDRINSFAASLPGVGAVIDNLSFSMEELRDSVIRAAISSAESLDILSHKLRNIDNLGDIFSGLTKRIEGASLSDATKAIGDKFEVGIIEAIGRATDAKRAVTGFFSDAAQSASEKSVELAKSASDIGGSIKDIIPSVRQMSSAVIVSLGAVLSPIGGLALGLSRVGAAAIGAGSKVRFFGSAVRAALTGTASQTFISGLRDSSRAAITEMSTLGDRIPDNVIKLNKLLDNDTDAIRSLIKSTYIDPITSSIRSNAGTVTDALATTLSAPFDKIAGTLSSASGTISDALADGLIDPAINQIFAFSNILDPDIDTNFDTIRGKIRSIGLKAFGSVPGVQALQSAIDKLRDGAGITSRLNAAFGSLTGRIQKTVPFTGLLDKGFQGLTQRMIQSKGVTKTLGIAMARTGAAIRANESLTKALRGALTGLTGVQAGASVTTMLTSVAQSAYAAATSLATAATSALLGVLSILVSVLGVLSGALVVAVVLVGSVGAALAALGASGEDAESIMKKLTGTLKSIGEALMPAVVESSELMMDVFRSIAAPVGALIDGLKDIGVALGLIDESAGSGGLMNMLRAAVSAFTPLLEQAGLFARILGGELTAAIERVTARLVQFIEENNISEMIDNSVAVFGSLFQEVMALQEPLEQFVGTIISSVMPVFENILSSVSEIGGAISGMFGGAGEGGQGFFSTVQMVGEAIIGLLAPALDLLGSLFSAVMGIVNTLIDVFTAYVQVVSGIFGFLNEAVGGFLSGLLGVEDGSKTVVDFLISGFMSVVDILSGIMSGLSTFIDTIVELGSVIGPVIGFLFDGIMAVAGVVGDVLVGAFQNAGSIIRDAILFIADVFDSLFGGIIDTVAGFVNSVVRGAQVIADAFTSLPDTLREAWNSTIGGVELNIPSVTLGSNIPEIEETTIGGQSITLPEIPGGSGGGGSAGGSGEVISASKVTGEDLASGAGVVAGVGKKSASSLGGLLGGGGNVNVEEGDTTNVFNQSISAEPEDEAQMGRIAKDAMEEAESFKRRQQGSQ